MAPAAAEPAVEVAPAGGGASAPPDAALASPASHALDKGEGASASAGAVQETPDRAPRKSVSSAARAVFAVTSSDGGKAEPPSAAEAASRGVTAGAAQGAADAPMRRQTSSKLKNEGALAEAPSAGEPPPSFKLRRGESRYDTRGESFKARPSSDAASIVSALSSVEPPTERRPYDMLAVKKTPAAEGVSFKNASGGAVEAAPLKKGGGGGSEAAASFKKAGSGGSEAASFKKANLTIVARQDSDASVAELVSGRNGRESHEDAQERRSSPMRSPESTPNPTPSRERRSSPVPLSSARGAAPPVSARGSAPPVSARGAKSKTANAPSGAEAQAKTSRKGAADAGDTSLVARSNLKMRSGSEMDSAEAGSLYGGTRVRIVEERELPDGTRRVRVAADGGEGELAADPLGWVSLVAKNGNDNLVVPADYAGPPAPSTPEPKKVLARTARGPPTSRGSSAAQPSDNKSLDDLIEQFKRVGTIARAIDVFASVDDNKDGTVSKAEFVKALPTIGIRTTREQSEEFFDALDKDGSGSIDYDELHSKLREPIKKKPKPKPRALKADVVVDDADDAPDAMSVRTPSGIYVTKMKLKMRAGSELDSAEAGELLAGSIVRVRERRTLADGTQRSQVAPPPGQPGGSPLPALGWVSSLKEGKETLVDKDDPESDALVAASPSKFYDLIYTSRLPSPRPDRYGTDSQVFVTRSVLRVRADPELESEDLGTIAAGTQVRVLDRKELLDGTRRAAIGEHDEPLHSPRSMHHTPANRVELIGWVSCAGKGGIENLIVEWRK